MNDWYFLFDSKRMGPYNLEMAKKKAAKKPHGQAMRETWSDWKNITDVAELGVSGKRLKSTSAASQRYAPSNTQSDITTYIHTDNPL